MAQRTRWCNVRSALCGGIAATALALTSVLALAPSVSANTGGCQTPGGGLYGDRVAPNVCIRVESGWKNYGNHTEWIGHVKVEGTADRDKLEMWGDGFYYAARGSWFEVYVDRRVRNGTHICGGNTDPYAVRAVACVNISV
jgi:hypothetical protein